MGRTCLPVLLVLCLLLAACSPVQREADGGDQERQLLATTYPVYLFASEVTRGAEDVTVSLMIDQPVSCLHDYTLTVQDMKALEKADMVLLNGAGLEEAMEDALDTVSATPQIDCSQGIQLLEGEAHDHDHAGHDHDHEKDASPDGHDHEDDPHIWMDPQRASAMIENLAQGLAQWDPDNAALYETNSRLAQEQIAQAYDLMKTSLADLSCRELITFHDGFAYFAEAFDLEILRAIEEEAGSEASAKEVVGIVEEIQYHHLPAIFTEVNGATATAEMIQRECGVAIFQLDLMMSRHQDLTPGVAAYLDLLQTNVNTLREAYS